MEDLAEGIGRGFLNLIKWIIIDVFIELFIHGYGYLTLKILTLGKYPKLNKNNDTLCVISGFISFAVTIAIIMYINSN
tara:strand:- start:189 stop:422 length:234 start_codon:yes stop_codon:yes gene_type:complete